ncbi:MAG TPA: hypothetical protein VF175_06860 [Lacipirellula sp.]
MLLFRYTFAFLVVAVVGCSKQSAAPTTPVAKATPAANKQAQPKPKPAKAEPEPTEPETLPTTEELEPTANLKPTPQRIALLTPGGPLLVDVYLTIDGHGYAQALDAQLDTVIAAADADDDDRPTWKELLANKEFLESPLAGAQNATARQKRDWADLYDLNDNDLVDRDEAAAWIGRNSGRSAKAFSVRSTRSARPDPRATSRLWPLLDKDRDGKLSAIETRDASQSLLALDANDDLMLSAQELLPLRDQLMAADGDTAYGRTNTEHFAALHLEEGDDPARLEYLLNDLYAPRQDLTPASFPALPRLGEQLDANSDNWLDREELAKLRTINAHLQLTVSFGSEKPAEKTDPAAGKPARRGPGDQVWSRLNGTPTIQITADADDITILSESSPVRKTISLGGTPITISAHDLAGASLPSQPGYMASGADANMIRLLAHDRTDAVFAEIDANADARLSEREIKSVRDRLLSRDANQDRALADEELPYSMIVAFIRGEAAGEQSFYVPASSPAPSTSGLAPPPWFTDADLNADGEISRREFLGTADHFSGVDLSRDGYITADEAAQTSAAP